jgi:hypothetical protein
MHFKVRRQGDKEENLKSGGNEDSDNTYSENRSGFDGGLGGRAHGGEWQIELSYIPTDPRDPSRSTGAAAASDYQTITASVQISPQDEEFPALPSESKLPPRAVWAHGSLSRVQNNKNKINDFPALNSSNKPVSNLTKSSNAKLAAPSLHSSSSSSSLSKYSSSENNLSNPVLPNSDDFPKMKSKDNKHKKISNTDSNFDFHAAVTENTTALKSLNMYNNLYDLYSFKSDVNFIF